MGNWRDIPCIATLASVLSGDPEVLMIDREWLKSLVEAGRRYLLESETPLTVVDSAFLSQRAGVRPHRSEAERLILLGLAADVAEKDARLHHREGHSLVMTPVLSHIRARSRDSGTCRHTVAQAQQVSGSWLGHRLKRETGRSFTEHLTNARLSDASDQLGDFAISVKEAALTAGFPTANAFTKLFKRRHGITPTKWRELQAAKSQERR